MHGRLAWLTVYMSDRHLQPPLLTTMSLNIVDIIKTDHDNVRDLFQKFKAATDTDKVAIGNTILREMSVHGDAEDASLYNTFEQKGLGKVAAIDRSTHTHPRIVCP
ncbi:hypothetical protein C8Q80DRAFT_1168662, partial [Daedaleopsis nitida]